MSRSRTARWAALAGLAGLMVALPGGAEEGLVSQAVHSEDARRQLRAMGPIGLTAMLAAHADALASPRRGPVHDALDAVAGQRDAHASRLYWYTDLDAATAAARAQGKPILSLRLLGRLDQDLSCANSRFFRAALYPNATVGEALRERFVLHWQSVRPVPVLTVDFGDGRRLQRPVTGNSIHYVLDPSARVVDALPGLYGPQAFLAALERAEALALEVAPLDDPERLTRLQAWHGERRAALDAGIREAGLPAALLNELASPRRVAAETSSATRASARTASKMVVEAPLLAELDPAFARDLLDEPAARLRDTGLFLPASRLDADSLALLRWKLGAPADDPQVRLLVDNLERAISRDTLLNELGWHRTLHGWFADGAAAQPLDRLNERVYEDLFLMPADDAWLGLAPDDIYAALDGNGLSTGWSSARR